MVTDLDGTRRIRHSASQEPNSTRTFLMSPGRNPATRIGRLFRPITHMGTRLSRSRPTGGARAAAPSSAACWTCPTTGEIGTLRLVTDNGSCSSAASLVAPDRLQAPHRAHPLPPMHRESTAPSTASSQPPRTSTPTAKRTPAPRTRRHRRRRPDDLQHERTRRGHRHAPALDPCWHAPTVQSARLPVPGRPVQATCGLRRRHLAASGAARERPVSSPRKICSATSPPTATLRG